MLHVVVLIFCHLHDYRFLRDTLPSSCVPSKVFLWILCHQALFCIRGASKCLPNYLINSWIDGWVGWVVDGMNER